MKHDVFNQYVERVSDLFSVSRDEMFSKSKKRECVDARHLVYYLCNKRPMQITYIQKYMREAGYEIKHSSIIYGISSVEQRMEEDRDYVSIVKEVERAVFI
jgi:chromosomal replication initiation ATPase DnaA